MTMSVMGKSTGLRRPATTICESLVASDRVGIVCLMCDTEKFS